MEEEEVATPSLPSCWVIFQNAHDVFRSVVNEMEYDIRSKDPLRHEQFPSIWRRFQKYSTLHADMEECGFFRLLEGISNKNTADLVSWELHQADSDAVIKVDNMLAKYQGRPEVFEKILPAYLEWQEVHFRHLDYEDEAWAPVITSFHQDDTLRRNQIVYQMVTSPAHIHDPLLCCEYYAWVTKHLSLYGTPQMNHLDATVSFVRGLRCVCDAKQWAEYIPAIRDACTLSIWDHLIEHHQIELPDPHEHLLGDNTIYQTSSENNNKSLFSNDNTNDDTYNDDHNHINNRYNTQVPDDGEDGEISTPIVQSSSTHNHNSGISSTRWSVSLVDVSLARASFALVGTRGSFFQQSRKIIPGTEWWNDLEHVNSAKETSAIMSNMQSFHSNSIQGLTMDSKRSLLPPHSTNNENNNINHNANNQNKEEISSSSNGHRHQPSAANIHINTDDEFHFNKFRMPNNSQKSTPFHLRRGSSTMPVKLMQRPTIFPQSFHGSYHSHQHHHNHHHHHPLRSRVFAHIFLSCICGDDPSAVHHGAHKKKKEHHHHHNGEELDQYRQDKKHSKKKNSSKKKKKENDDHDVHQDIGVDNDAKNNE